jgi:hypothetical protein
MLSCYNDIFVNDGNLNQSEIIKCLSQIASTLLLLEEHRLFQFCFLKILWRKDVDAKSSLMLQRVLTENQHLQD